MGETEDTIAALLKGKKHKKDKAEVAYQSHPKGSQQCSKCSMYIPSNPPHCTDVKGSIESKGWCRIFYAKTKD